MEDNWKLVHNSECTEGSQQEDTLWLPQIKQLFSLAELLDLEIAGHEAQSPSLPSTEQSCALILSL